MSAPETAVDKGAAATAQGDGASAPKSDDLVGTVISERYKIEKVLGKGGMGAVYLVQHVHMRKHYALKMLHAETSQNPELVARFEREAVASAHAEHPNITVATDFGRTDGGGFFLVLEYLEGKRLRDLLGSGPLPPKRAVHIARQVACALEVSHGLGIVHRDLGERNSRREIAKRGCQGNFWESWIRSVSRRVAVAAQRSNGVLRTLSSRTSWE